MRNFCLLSIFLLAATGLLAQLPVNREPHHKVVLENDYIRVLEGKIPPNDTTPLHRHAANSVVVFLSPSTFGIRTSDGQISITTVQPGDTKYAPYGDKPVDHIVWDETAVPLHFFVVELSKQPAAPRSCPALRIPGLVLRWREPRVDAYDLQLVNGRTCHLPPSSCGKFLVAISGSSTDNGQKLLPDQFRFIPPGRPADLKGNGHCILLII